MTRAIKTWNKWNPLIYACAFWPCFYLFCHVVSWTDISELGKGIINYLDIKALWGDRWIVLVLILSACLWHCWKIMFAGCSMRFWLPPFMLLRRWPSLDAATPTLSRSSPALPPNADDAVPHTWIFGRINSSCPPFLLKKKKSSCTPVSPAYVPGTAMQQQQQQCPSPTNFAYRL